MSAGSPGLKTVLAVFLAGVAVAASAMWAWQAFQERPRPMTIPRPLESFPPGVVAYFVIPGDEAPLLRQLWQGKPRVEPVGSIAFFLVNHETEGFLALYARDPHLGCFVQWQEASEQFRNPCHGETYTKAGQCLFGPCPRGLDRFVLELREGELIVHLNRLMPGPPRLEFRSLTPTPLPTPQPYPYQIPLEVEIAPGQSTYLPGEEVEIRLSFKNVSEDTLELGTFPPTVVIGRPRGETEVWRSPAGGTKRTLAPGQGLSHEVVWDQRQLNGNLVDPGYYYISVRDVTMTRAGRPAIISHPAYSRVLIPHPQGAIARTVDIEQTQIASGVAITLRRLELSTTGALVYGFVQPPDWSPATPSSPPWMPTPTPTPAPYIYPVSAQYRLDKRQMRDAGSAGFTWLPEGVGLIWDLIDPVPNGTEELTFVIARFGEWPGPWEFQVPVH